MKKNGIHNLHKLLGRWKTTGKIIGTDQNIEGTDSYEMLFGDFILHKADVKMGNEKSETYEIISYDKEHDRFLMEYYNNKGEKGQMAASIENDQWIFSNSQLRFKGGFSINDQVFSGLWSQKDDDGSWQPFIEIQLKRIE